MNTNNITNYLDYIAWRAMWRSKHATLVAEIRAKKHISRSPQQEPVTQQNDRSWSQHLLHGLKAEATAMYAERAESKEISRNLRAQWRKAA